MRETAPEAAPGTAPNAAPEQKARTGSRFLYEPFGCGAPNCGPGARMETHERVAEERWKALEFRLGLIEAMIGRLEKRLWLTIVGVAGVVLGEAATTLLLP